MHEESQELDRQIADVKKRIQSLSGETQDSPDSVAVPTQTVSGMEGIDQQIAEKKILEFSPPESSEKANMIENYRKEAIRLAPYNPSMSQMYMNQATSLENELFRRDQLSSREGMAADKLSAKGSKSSEDVTNKEVDKFVGQINKLRRKERITK